jgi:hypothetical protein
MKRNQETAERVIELLTPSLYENDPIARAVVTLIRVGGDPIDALCQGLKGALESRQDLHDMVLKRLMFSTEPGSVLIDGGK